ncbi:MAG TPA: DUF3619 family protein [Usitatibacter sp.]|nr:DUF3619 family protein [Usitatibacter sp.]
MKEKEFADRVKPWLERGATQIGEMQATRLKAARLRAMDAYREPVSLMGLAVSRGTLQAIQYNVVQRALLVIPLVALLAALAIKSANEADLGELDAQLLTQELPPDAFLDQDLRSWLGHSQL